MGGHSENFSFLGPPGAEIWPLLVLESRDLKFFTMTSHVIGAPTLKLIAPYLAKIFTPVETSLNVFGNISFEMLSKQVVVACFAQTL